jgi:hypothetical protein
MTLEELHAWHVAQRDALAAYFNTDDTDGKTAKSYRKLLAASQARVDLLAKIMVDGHQVN